MGYHIKRDGQYLCRTKIVKTGIFKNKYAFIPFKDAHTSDLIHCCDKCKERYFQIVNNMKDPVIVNDKKKRLNRGSEDVISQTSVDQKDYLPVKLK
jgi:hypothetical protein